MLKQTFDFYLFARLKILQTQASRQKEGVLFTRELNGTSSLAKKKEKEPVPKKIESDKQQGDKKLLNQKQGLQKKENSDSGLSDELGSDSDW